MRALHRALPVLAFAAPATTSLTGVTPPVPDVRGLTRDAAVSTLLRAGYRVALDPFTAPEDPLSTPNVVADQDPISGQAAPYASVITLTMTAGSSIQVVIPEPWQLPAVG
jgi:beta-lactam-binding protein with PASTA domain